MNCPKFLALLSGPLLLSSVLAGCGPGSATQAPSNRSALSRNAAGEYDKEDWDATWDAATAVPITLSGDSIKVSGSGAVANGSTLAIYSAGTYVLSGTLEDGQILIRAGEEDTVRLVLSGAQITNTRSAPIYAQQAEKLIITLADGSENVVTDGAVYENAGTDEPNAAIFSKDDLTINGSGSLRVIGNFKNGIGTKDDLVVTGGNIVVNAPNDAIRGRDSISIGGGNLTITAGSDGIQSNDDEDEDNGWIAVDGGTLDITAVNDGIQAETTLTVTGGDLNLVTGGGSANASKDRKDDFFMPGGGQWGGAPDGSGPGDMPGNPPDMQGNPPKNMPQDAPTAPSGKTRNKKSSGTAINENTTSDSAKGLKAGKRLVITGGTITVDASDDALHTNGSVSIQGGTMRISSGDDGIHADEALTINGGSIEITNSYEGIEGTTIALHGGTIHLISEDDGINGAGGADGSGAMGSPGGGRSFEESGSSLTITGGLVVVDAKGDGIDINGSIKMTGGTVLVSGPTNSANGALDYGTTFNISGGTLVAAGSAGMAVAPSDTSSQPSLMVYYSSTQPAGTLINLSTTDGTPIVTFAPAKEYQTVVISTPGLTQGKTYVLYSGGAVSGEASGDLLTAQNYTGGSELTQVTLSDMVTTISDDGTPVTGRRGMGPGGMPPNGGGVGPGGKGGGRTGGGQGGTGPQTPGTGSFAPRGFGN